MKILIADDDPVHVRLVAGVLKRKGIDTVAAYDALQAWTNAVRLLPDAIILDISMPCGTGREVLRRLKSSTRTQTIPVVVVSSIGPAGEAEVKALGADAFLRKPVDTSQLLDALGQLVGPPNPV